MAALARVWYELFAHEAERLDAHLDAEAFELGRQVRLELADGACWFIAWTWSSGRDDYHVGFAPQSFCTDLPEAERDVSGSPLWLRLVGAPFDLAYLDDMHQILVVRGGGAEVFCCSFSRGAWGMDELHVSVQVPVPKPSCRGSA
jgi:hypothetical protein